MPERKDTGSDDTKKSRTQVSSDGQYELTEASTPLYEASEELIKCKARVGRSKDDLAKAEKNWIDEMKKVKKSTINHKGDIIEYVKGRTSDDHARFKKS
jgi:hypothetical protein